MQAIDFKRIDSLINDIEKEEGFLSDVIKLTSLDDKTTKAIKYSLIVTIEAMLQICQHILARKFKIPVSGYRDAFKRLINTGLLQKSFQRRFNLLQINEMSF